MTPTPPHPTHSLPGTPELEHRWVQASRQAYSEVDIFLIGNARVLLVALREKKNIYILILIEALSLTPGGAEISLILAKKEKRKKNVKA